MKLCGVVVALAAGVAHADPAVDRAVARALTVEAAQHQFQAGQHAACGAAFMAIYRADPKAADGDEQLFNAAVCFERAHLPTDAIDAYATLGRAYPRSHVAAMSQPRHAKLELDTGHWDVAAALFEDYAARYPGEKNAPDAASDALQTRLAFGPPAKAIADAAIIEKTWRGRAVAADAAFLLATTIDDAHAIERRRDYIHEYGSRPQLDRVARLSIEVAERLLAQSCAGGETAGLCTKPAPTTPPACGFPLAAAPRDAAKVRDARAELGRAIHAADAMTDRDASRDLYARAHLHVLDLDLEAAIATREVAKIAAAVAATEGVLGVPAPWTLAAMARVGELDRALADVATCRQAPPETRARAIDALVHCEQLAAQISVDDAAAARCHRLLLDLAPDRTIADALPPIAFSLDPIDAAPIEDPVYEADFEAFTFADAGGWLPATCKKLRAAFAQGSATAAYMQGLVAARCGDPAAALVKFELAEKGHLAAAAAVGHGRAAWLLGKRAAAIAAWQAALAIDPRAYAAAIDLAMAHRDRAAVQAALALEPGDPVALGALAALDPPRAAFYIRGIDADHPLHAVLAAQHGGLVAPRQVVTAEDARIAGLVELHRRHWKEAAELLPRAAPTYDVLVGLGVAYHQLHRDADARALFDRAIALDAARPEAPADRALAAATTAVNPRN